MADEAMVHIFVNGKFVDSKPIEFVGDGWRFAESFTMEVDGLVQFQLDFKHASKEATG